jgi:hypothetical protein
VTGPILETGKTVLKRAMEFPLRVLESGQKSVSEASILEEGRVVAISGNDGRAALLGRNPDQEILLEVRKEGYLPAMYSFPAPLPEEGILWLTRAAEVRGCLELKEGGSVEAEITTQTGSESSETRTDGIGCFRLPFPPHAEVELTFRPREARRLKVSVTLPAAGEIEDLGRITVHPGVSLSGVVLNGRDSTPVAGARVWAMRSEQGGPVMAWMQRRAVEAETDLEGSFSLKGLDPGSVLLHWEAAGFAPGSKTLEVSSPNAEVPEPLTLFLDEGSSLTVHLQGEAEGKEELIVDAGGQQRPEDFIRAWFVEDLARIEHLPVGRHRFQVRRGHRRVCQGEAELLEAGLEVETTCRADRLTVYGKVRLGGTLAPGGALRWMQGEPKYPDVVLTYVGEGGLRRQQTFSWGSEQILITVADDGTFESSDLTTGPWQVFWEKGAQRSTGQLQNLTAEATGPVILDFPGATLRGRVIGSEGEPIEGAQVRDQGHRISVRTDTAGEFTAPGVDPGPYLLQARKEDITSAWVPVEVLGVGNDDLVVLELKSEEQSSLQISVLSPEGRPVPGGFVFVDLGTGGFTLRSLDLNGSLLLPLPKPIPTRARAAVFSGGAWAFGAWANLDEPESALELTLRETGSLAIRNVTTQTEVQVTAPGDWNLGSLLRRLGRSPVADSEGSVTLSGLPEGRYRAEIAGQSGEVTVRAGEQVEIQN